MTVHETGGTPTPLHHFTLPFGCRFFVTIGLYRLLMQVRSLLKTFLQTVFEPSALVMMLVVLGMFQPLASYAQSDAAMISDDLTVERVRTLREQVLNKRMAAAQARGAAFDQRAKKDVERALRPDTDRFFDDIRRPKARALREACAAKDWSACSELGQMYHAGEGTWVDEHLAFAFFLRACFPEPVRVCRDLAGSVGNCLGYLCFPPLLYCPRSAGETRRKGTRGPCWQEQRRSSGAAWRCSFPTRATRGRIQRRSWRGLRGRSGSDLLPKIRAIANWNFPPLNE